VVVDRLVADAADRLEQRVLRADARVVEPGRHRVRLLDLAVRVLQQQRVAALQHARRAVGERGGVLAEATAAAASLEPEQRHFRVADQGMEESDRVRAAADAGHGHVRQAPCRL
jgi:hypothetical protein